MERENDAHISGRTLKGEKDMVDGPHDKKRMDDCSIVERGKND